LATITIALDAMGGDFGPSVVVPAAIKMLLKEPHLAIFLVGDEAAIKQQLVECKSATHARLQIIHTTEVVGMDELPSQALRGKKDSSMRVAINLVKENKAQACVSAGNTGALMATAKFVLKTLPGIDRPAIITALPTEHETKTVRVLDLGANVDSSADDLLQFAVMGSVLTEAVENIKQPRVALLNIGEEEIKGNDQVKQTAQLLTESKDINYIGYIEGDDVFKNAADVVVCDGFVGNVSLKVMEGIAKMIAHYIKTSFHENWYTKLIGLIATPVLKNIKKRIDPSRYNGASFLGLQGIVIKSHGGANILGYCSAIHEAIKEVEKNVPKQISDRVGALLETEKPNSTN